MAVCRRVVGRTAMLLALVLSIPSTLTAQSVEGRVIDAASGEPVGNATISVLREEGALLSVGSDSLGFFRIALPGPGPYALRVERLGYTALTTDAVTVGANELLEVELRMGVDALPLSPLVVTSRRAALVPHADFYRRMDRGRSTGTGQFLTREDLEAVQLPLLSSHLARLSRVTLWTEPSPPFKTHVVLDGACFPAVYVNGVPVRLLEEGVPGTSLDDLFHAEDLEGLEVYTRRLEIPPEYAGPDVCGVIVAWTRLPAPESDDSLWRWVLGGSIVLGLLLVSVF